MKTKVYSIHDEKAQAYLPPFYFEHHGQALRAFESSLKDKQSNIAMYPQDYKIYYLGDFDKSSGKFTSLNEPQFLNNATDFLKGEDNNASDNK